VVQGREPRRSDRDVDAGVERVARLHAHLGALHAGASPLDPDGAVRVEHDLDDQGVVEEGREGPQGAAQGEREAGVGLGYVGGGGVAGGLLHFRPPFIEGGRNRAPENRRGRGSEDAAPRKRRWDCRETARRKEKRRARASLPRLWWFTGECPVDAPFRTVGRGRVAPPPRCRGVARKGAGKWWALFAPLD